jgi:hypothetical protein
MASNDEMNEPAGLLKINTVVYSRSLLKRLTVWIEEIHQKKNL